VRALSVARESGANVTIDFRTGLASPDGGGLRGTSQILRGIGEGDLQFREVEEIVDEGAGDSVEDEITAGRVARIGRGVGDVQERVIGDEGAIIVLREALPLNLVDADLSAERAGSGTGPVADEAVDRSGFLFLDVGAVAVVGAPLKSRVRLYKVGVEDARVGVVRPRLPGEGEGAGPDGRIDVDEGEAEIVSPTVRIFGRGTGIELVGRVSSVPTLAE